VSVSSDAKRIAQGHAWTIHRNEFPDIATVHEFAVLIDTIMQNPSASKVLSRGRAAFWHQASGTVVIRDPRNSDLGTAFKPVRGNSYFDKLR
jgi:filamentous hemagglutinin